MSKTSKCSAYLSTTLSDISSKITSEYITLKDFLKLMDDRGKLVVCMVLASPFLIPVSIPGSSTLIGMIILFIGVSMALNRFLLPNRILNYKLPKNTIIKILNGSMNFLGRVERFIKPRLLILTNGSIINSINGALLVYTAILLMLPLPVPLTDAMPAYAIFFLTAGSLECDGYLILASYLMIIITTIYFGLVILLGWEGLFKILSLFGL